MIRATVVRRMANGASGEAEQRRYRETVVALNNLVPFISCCWKQSLERALEHPALHGLSVYAVSLSYVKQRLHAVVACAAPRRIIKAPRSTLSVISCERKNQWGVT